MSLTLDLPPDLERELSTESTRLGLSLADYVLRLILFGPVGGPGPKTGAELVAYWQAQGLIGSRSSDGSPRPRNASNGRGPSEPSIRDSAPTPDAMDRIRAEIASLGRDELDELSRVVQDLVKNRISGRKPGLLSRLRRIQIDAPEDFAANLDRDVDEGRPGDG